VARERKIFHLADEVSTVSGVGDEKSHRICTIWRSIFHLADEVSTVVAVGDEKCGPYISKNAPKGALFFCS
ncbi:MAG: hypothetical protein MJ145_04015, partial [Clostridia bacterium]|nr:hypothetical protein [Clostridia bacterium]